MEKQLRAADQELIRRGPWSVEEDFALINYVANHGEGRWNSLATSAGLNRTGKSCRLRWLNYLRPDVRRGNITLEEQLLILELHSRWGNRWSKIAQHLPGRTDNEIKNYWRTRVQKHAKQLKCDVNSKQFKDTMRYLWMPRLVERIQAAATAPDTTYQLNNNNNNHNMSSTCAASEHNVSVMSQPENSSTAASSESFESFNEYTRKQHQQEQGIDDNYRNNNQEYCYLDEPPPPQQQPPYGGDCQSVCSPTAGYFEQLQGPLDFMDTNYRTWMDGEDHLSVDVESLWNVDDVWF